MFLRLSFTRVAPSRRPLRQFSPPLSDLTASEHLDFVVGALHQPVLPQELRRHDGAGVETESERVEVDDLVLDAERIVEAALRHAAVQRHLAAFESTLEFEARTRFRALVPASGGLAVAGSLPAADALLRVLHPTRRFQIMKTHN
jgi:hypothetical protein